MPVEIVGDTVGGPWATERHPSQSSFPSEEPGRCFSLLDRLCESFPPDPLRPISLPIPGPIYTKGLTADLFFAHIAPEPTVQTLVAIVAHDVVRALRHGHRS